MRSVLPALLVLPIVLARSPPPLPASTRQVPFKDFWEPTIAPTITTIPPEFTSIPSQTHFWDPLVTAASIAVDEIEEHLNVDLRKRQGGVGLTALPGATTVATQAPTISTWVATSYPGGNAVYVTNIYTQTFAAVPEQWPTPSAGSVGLGTIQGQIGVIKTSKRSLAEPTPIPGQVVRIKGREVTLT